MTDHINSNPMDKALSAASQVWGRLHPKDQRSVKASKNVVISLFCKALRMCVGFILVPLSIDYLNPTRYGLWLTIFSVVMWIRLSDVGLGNGLRNHLAKAIAKGDARLARIYISTAYFAVAVILALIFLLFSGANLFVNWAKILNAPVETWPEVNQTVTIAFSLVCVYFMLQLIIRVCQANQEPAYREAVDLVSSVFLLAVIFYLCKGGFPSSLPLYGAIFTAVPVLVLVILHFILFTGRYREFTPSFRFVSFAHMKEVTALGLNFFVIQIASVVLYSTDNFLIAYLIGPEKVTEVSIPMRYFGILMTAFILIVSPLWSAVTDAYHKGDLVWIKGTVQKLTGLWVIAALACIAMLILSQYFYHFWIGNRVIVGCSLSVIICALVIARIFGSIFTNVINGLGVLRVQLISGVAEAAINIPLSVLLAKYFGLGAAGVILATLLIVLVGVSLRLIQYKKLINGRATGIWAR